MAYKHDLFVSYMHDPVMEEWVHESLLPFVRTFVGNALNRRIEVFVDRNGIATGDSWPDALQHALAHSRALLAIWSPLYFHSPWCRRECAIMMYREQRLKYRTATRPGGLIIPINVFDGDFFPKKARRLQSFDCRDYWIVGQGFKQTEQYVRFQAALRRWAGDAAQTIGAAPAWRREWSTDRWFKVTDKHLMPKSKTNFSFTGLE